MRGSGGKGYTAGLEPATEGMGVRVPPALPE